MTDNGRPMSERGEPTLFYHGSVGGYGATFNYDPAQ